ncbi:unnamed protein product [Parajaminaea phylloscopi]
MATAQLPARLPRSGSAYSISASSSSPSGAERSGNGAAAASMPPRQPSQAMASDSIGEGSAATGPTAPAGSLSPQQDDTTATRRKRTRPVSACEACRAHKVKCILKPDQPICERCSASNKECLFRIDDLRPDFRAERFSHLGPPGAEAREIKSKPKDKKREGSRQRKETSTTSAGESDEAEEKPDDDAAGDGGGGMMDAKKPKRVKRMSSSAGTADDSLARIPGSKTKPVFKSFANPHHLAAPAPSLSGPGSTLPPPPPGMARPGPSVSAHAYSPPRSYHAGEHSMHQPHPGPYPMHAPPPPAHPAHHHSMPAAAPQYPVNAAAPHHPYGYSDGHHASSTGVGSRPPYSHLDSAPPGYGHHHLNGTGASPPNSYHPPPPRSPSERAYHPHGRMSSVNSASSTSGALPPIRMAFPGIDESSSPTVHGSDKRRFTEWDRPSTAASDTRSERPFSPVVARSPATFQHSHEDGHPEKGHSAPTPSRVAFQLPPEESHTAIDHPTTSSTGSKGSSTKKSSLVVPFFRWFGSTANTPGYRRIKVAVNPDLPEEEDGTLPAGTEQQANDGDSPLGLRQSAARGTTGEGGESEQARDADNGAGDGTGGNAKTPSKDGNAPTPSARTPQLKSLDFAFTPGSRPGPNAMSALEQDSIASSTTRDLFDPSRPRYPRKDVLLHLSELFLKYFRSNLCPWIIEEELIESARDCTMPSILANSICAMTARFSDWAEMRRKPPKSAGEPFSEMAKTLLVPMLSWPSLDVIEALIILSYAEFGAGSDSGLWMYSGMGMRMAIDLGIEHESTIMSLPDEAQQTKARWLFWSGCYAIDRITCFGTGRPVTLLDHAIDCLPPQVDPSADTFYASQIIQILLRRGRMGELLNRRDDGMTLNEKKARLTELWQECAAYFQSLPSTCAFGVQSFKRAASKNQGAAFLYLHVLFQSTISLLERPGLMRGREIESAPSAFGAVTHVSASASRSIVDMIALAAQVDPKSFHACPYLDQLILPTGRLFVSEREAVTDAMRSCGYMPGQSRQSSPTRGLTKPQDDRLPGLIRHRKTISDQLSNCIAWLSKLAHFWGGASWPARALEQEAAGASDVIPDLDDDDAMQAPLRDMELLSSWAKEKVKKAKGRMASRRGSLQHGSGPLSLTKGKGGASSLASPGAATSIANLLAAANAAQEGAASSAGSSAGLDDNPLGLALSGQLATSAEIDIHALVDMWAAEQERIQSGTGTNGPNTPYASGTAQSSKGWEVNQINGQGHHPHNGGNGVLTHPGQTYGQGQASSNAFGSTIGFSNFSGHPPVDFSALQLEELLSADLGMASGDDVFPLELPIEDFQLSGVAGGPMDGSGSAHGHVSHRQSMGHGQSPSSATAAGSAGSGGVGSHHHQTGGSGGGGFVQGSSSFGLPQGFSSALFGFH